MYDWCRVFHFKSYRDAVRIGFTPPHLVVTGPYGQCSLLELSLMRSVKLEALFGCEFVCSARLVDFPLLKPSSAVTLVSDCRIASHSFLRG